MKNWMRKASTATAPPASCNQVVTTADVHCDVEGAEVSKAADQRVVGKVRDSKRRKIEEEPGIEYLDCVEEEPYIQSLDGVEKSIDVAALTTKPTEHSERHADEILVEKSVASDKRVRIFPRKWLRDHDWLRYDEAKKAMYCTICRDHHGSGSFANGTRNFR